MKSMRRHLPFLLGGALAFSVCQKNVSDDPLNEEFAKHDPWIKQAFGGHMRVMIVEKDDMSFEDRLGYVDTYGLYDSQSDILFLPRNKDFTRETLDAIDHELAHVLTDSVGLKGLLFQSAYRGPSLEEISQHMSRVYPRPEFDSLRIWYAEDAITRENLKSLQSIKMLMEAYDDHKTIFTEMNEYVQEHKRFEGMVDRRKIRKDGKKIQKGLEELASLCQKVVIPDSTDYKNLYYKRLLRVQADTIAGRTGVFQEIHAYCDEVFGAFGRAQEEYYAERIAELEKRIEMEDDWKRYLAELKRVEQEFAEAKGDQEGWLVWNRLRRRLASFSMSFSTFTSEREYESGMRSMEGIMNDSMEIFARMMDSLYSLHYSSPTQFKFPLSDDDLDFLSSFRFEGEQVFKKGIERYRLGRRMIEDGAAPEEVATLEFAERFTYNGITYQWPRTQVKVSFVQ